MPMLMGVAYTWDLILDQPVGVAYVHYILHGVASILHQMEG